MAKIEKLIEKMRRQPKGITFDEVKKALEYAGYREVRSNGSHHHTSETTKDFSQR